jgi:hypothetical protein
VARGFRAMEEIPMLNAFSLRHQHCSNLYS